MMAKAVFDMLEDINYTKELFTYKLKKETVTTKDGKVLSQKQANCLYNYFDLDAELTIGFIKNHNYKEISKTIGEAIEYMKSYYNEHYENYGDR